MAYAGSSANLLTKLILENHNDSYRWECLFRTPLNNYDAVILLHREKLPYPQRLLFPSELHQGAHVACGNASKVFQPFLLPADFKGSIEDLRNKVLVNFDPLRCFIGDLEKRGREEPDEEVKDPIDLLKNVGKVGTGFVRDIYLLKAPRRS